jgi:hypothetical protein
MSVFRESAFIFVFQIGRQHILVGLLICMQLYGAVVLLRCEPVLRSASSFEHVCIRHAQVDYANEPIPSEPRLNQPTTPESVPNPQLLSEKQKEALHDTLPRVQRPRTSVPTRLQRRTGFPPPTEHRGPSLQHSQAVETFRSQVNHIYDAMAKKRPSTPSSVEPMVRRGRPVSPTNLAD